ncbi:helix-turn-helix transcriptional regulator [Streptococcus agalactiae]
MSKYAINKIKVGYKIKDIRDQSGLSMMEFGKRIGVTDVSVNSYEKGRMIPKSNVLKKIISLSNNPNQSMNEFLYGQPKEYLENIFNSILISLEGFEVETKEFKELITILSKKLDCLELGYGDEASIIEDIYFENRKQSTYLNLKLIPEYIHLRSQYNLEPIKYDIEENSYFRSNLLPELDKYLVSKENQINDMKLISLLASSLYDYEMKKGLKKQLQEINQNKLDRFISKYDNLKNEEEIRQNLPISALSFALLIQELENRMGVTTEMIKEFIDKRNN